MSDAPRRSTRLNKNQEEEKAKAKAVDQDVEMEESPAESSTNAPKEKVLGAKELEALVIA
ncbi:hypothetical protein BGX21_002060, partial [Mortierella sp. AD011]